MGGGLGGGTTLAYGAAAGLLVLLGIAAGAALAIRGQRRRDERLREMRAALRASEDRLRWALDATSEIVWDWDLASDTLYHPAWAHTYGFPEERTPRTGAELVPFIHPEDMRRFQEELRAALAGPHDGFEVEHRALTGSGEWKWMRGRARVVARNAAGRGTRVVGTCTDITERKRMLARLQIADRMASIGTLAAGVAHEINNPLAYVIGNLDGALQQLEPLAQPREEGQAPPAGAPLGACVGALRDALSGAWRMREIVRDLKRFSRVDGGDEREPVEVGHALRAALSLGDHEIRHRARVALDVADVPPVLASQSRLSQVFLNLLVNAAQAMPVGQADRNEIRVTVRRRGARDVVVEVRDTGCGIAPEHRKQLFDPFFTTKPVGLGTGLGLPVCHGIVTALGGEIEVESEVGRGSTFRVILPGTDAAPAAPGARPEDVAAPPRATGPRARLLVVDDEPLFCRMVERTLGAEHEVVALTDAREALRRVQAGERYDAALMDLAMPVLTGMELHAEVARVAPVLAERTLFATGGAFTETAVEFVARHRDRVLEKPIAPEALRTAVARVLERSGRAADAPAA